MAHVTPAALARRKQSGHAIVETAFMLPWIFFLFVGVLDMGFYSYAAISVENAARVAALKTSQVKLWANDNTVACQAALGELRTLLNVGTTITTCNALPVIVSAAAIPWNATADQLPLNEPIAASRVSVTYQTPPLVPIPGILTGQLTLTRAAEMKVQEQ